MASTIPVRAQSELEHGEKKFDWAFHESISNMFDSKFPKKYRYKVFPFQFNENTIAYAGEIQAKVEEKNSPHPIYFFIRFSQTFGDELTLQKAKQVLKKEAIKYEILAKDMKGGELISIKDVEHKGFFGKDVYITYMENGDKFGLRTRILMTNYGKVEQTVISPTFSIFTYKIDDFFNSISPRDGISRVSNLPLGTGWIEHPAQTNVFTAVLPPKNSYYTPNDPEFKSSETREAMNFTILNPVADDDSFLRINSYKLNENITPASLQRVLIKNHVSKYIKNATPSSLSLEPTTLEDGTKILRTNLVIPPLPKTPNLTSVMIEVRYKKNFMIVQEYLSSGQSLRSGLGTTLMQLTKFHPEKYKKPAPTAKPKPKSE